MNLFFVGSPRAAAPELAFNCPGDWKMKLSHFLIGTALLSSLSGCNIFDPSDEVSVKTGNSSALITEGDRCFRDGDYDRAVELFSRALAKDSTRSEAWFGLSKASFYANGGNPYRLLREVNSGATIPLMELDSAEVENYASALRASLAPLRELVRRDTISRNDPSRELSDRRVVYSNFSVSYAVLEFASTILQFRKSAGSTLSLLLRDDGSVEMDISSLYEKALLDETEALRLNCAIDSLKNDLSRTLNFVLPSATETLENSGILDSGDSGDVSQILDGTLKENAATVESSVNYYKLGDGIDNDGDGCVDEEILDGLDNDGDGFVDEDLRLVPLIRDADSAIVFIGVGKDSLDHDKNGISEDLPERTLMKNGRMLFAAEFPKIHWGGISENSPQQKIAADTDSTDIRYPLEARRRLVGRCWNNYSEEDFKAWFRNR